MLMPPAQRACYHSTPWTHWVLYAWLLTSAVARAAASNPFQHSIQVDPTFAYYTDRSPQSIAEELKVNGYKGMRYIVTRESAAKADLVAACHASGLAICYATFGNGVYATDDLPPGWQQWKMRLRAMDASAGGYHYLCMNHPEYRRWKKQQVVGLLRRIRFDAFEIVESFWPAYEGPKSDRYGCLCDHCRDAFARTNPEAKGFPNFTNPADPNYYQTNRQLYQQWMEFRARSVAAFMTDVINGPGGVRTNFPGLPVAVWGIADAVPDGVAKLKEWEGVDGPLLVQTVRPDLYVLQTDWPDWLKPDLAPDYVARYKPFAAAIRAVSDVPIQVQTDIGSNKDCRRGKAWISKCEAAAEIAGFAGIVSYEYHLSLDIYEAPPCPVSAAATSNKVTVIFNKRLNPTTAKDTSNYTVSPGGIKSANVDGNLVKLEVTGHPRHVTVQGLCDDPSRRLFKDYPAVTMPSPTTVRVIEP